MTIGVETSYGRLAGVERDGVAVFRGIPYARPPVGRLRFRPPERAAAWPGVRDATKSGPAAAQNTAGFGLFATGIGRPSEDCLYLNVWTPRAGAAARRPVMVWIHGGAFIIGAGSQPIYDGAALARRGDVVVVTLNYRLGALGFLALRELTGGRLRAGGNEGLQDQVAALEWVRDEIAAFGGDPGNVTIFGESAGAMSCATLLGAPRARGLFHRAILQSGSANYVSSPSHAARVAAALLARLDLSPDRAEGLLELSSDRIGTAQHELFWALGMSQHPLLSRLGPGERRLLLGLTLGLTLGRRRLGRVGDYARAKLLGLMRRRAAARAAAAPIPGGLSPAELRLLPFEPVVDGDLLPRPPFDAIGDGLSADVAVLVGTNLDEARLFSLGDPEAADLDEAQLRARCDGLARALGDAVDGRRIVEAHREARAARGESAAPADIWYAIESERTMREPAMRLAGLQAAHRGRTFAYLFDWASPAFGGALGSCHALELPFVFGTLDRPVLRSLVGAGAEARALAGRIQDAWIAFARAGDPSHAGLGEWPAYDTDRRRTMILGKACRVEAAPREPERAFWAAAASAAASAG